MTDIQKKCLLRFGCVLLAAIILACALIPSNADAKSSSEYYENAVLFWTNVERGRHGLDPLKTTAALQNAADTRASEISGYFSHTRPNGSRWTTAIKAEGISYSNAAENIAAGKATPYDTVTAWMNSEGHRANILNSKYAYMGAGYKYVAGSRYTHHWTQEFAGGVTYSGASDSFYVAPTGLTSDKSSLKLSVGGTEQLSGIPNPVYATEEISCASSNPAVVSVESVQVNVFTVKGVNHGTATLTLRCGGYSAAVTVTVGTGINTELPFVDVSPSSVYYRAVVWAYKSGIVSGTDASHFSPNMPCTRGQVVTFLWRAAGCPTVYVDNPFTDVKKGSYCYDAVLWAYKSGITNGADATHFLPDKTVTREQFVTMLWKYRGSPSAECENPFEDISDGAYYYDAVLWAYSEGVTLGISASRFGVGNPCERYQVTMFLYRNMN